MGSYDGEPTYQAIANRQPEQLPTVIIPPRSTAVPSDQADRPPTQRDRHIRHIRDQGRMAWQKATGYGRRSLAETGIGRYKAAIGPRLRTRTLPGQQGEVTLAAAVLNRMIRTAKPVSAAAR